VRLEKPHLKDIALVMAEDEVASSRSSTPSADAMHASSTSASANESDKPAVSGLRLGLKGFATMKERIDKTAKETAQALNIPLPSDKTNTAAALAPLRKRKKIPFRQVPRYLVMLIGRAYMTFDLHRFIRTVTKAPLPGYNGHSLSLKVVSQKPMIVTKFLTFAPECEGDSDDGSDGVMLCAAAVNTHGLMVMIAAKQKALINHTQLVNETEDESQSLDFGCVLSNGSCYLVRSGGEMVHSTSMTMINSDLRLPHSLPDRASPGANPPKEGLMLLHGRESAIAAARNAARKRRSSMIKLTSAPFELSKVFSKTREQRAKGELMGGDYDSEDQPRGVGSAAARGATGKAGKAMSGLNETKEAFDLRGEKINRAALKADEIKDSASQFSKVAKQQKEELKKKNNRWGLF